MNPAIFNAKGSTIRALHAKRRPTSIDLGLGEPSLMPDVTNFERATAWVAEHGCRYTTNHGDPELREAIAKEYAYPGMDAADNVCITTGSQEAVYVAMRTLLDPAQDEVLIVEPAFPVYAKIAEIDGIAVRRLQIDPRGEDPFDPDAVLAAVGPNTRLIVVCSPCNPTGRVISRDSVKRIADGLLERGGEPIYVLHDEIYRELIYTDDMGEFGKVYPYTIAINSLSKSNALTGLRLGWIVAPSDVMPHIVKMHGWVTSCASTFAQRVALEIFTRKQLTVALPWYKERRANALAAIAETGLEYIEPDGAFYLCVRVGASDTLAFAEALIAERDVVAIPAHIFGKNLAGWLRTSFVSSEGDVREGLHRIAAFANEHATRAGTVVT
jgi:aspartate/methionine/tyrosine aminotransferase